MTRNSDLYMDDVFGCTHEPEVAVTNDAGAIVEWRCRCGRKVAAQSLSDEDVRERQRQLDIRLAFEAYRVIASMDKPAAIRNGALSLWERIRAHEARRRHACDDR